jgi:hypothetical protein
MDPPIPDQTTRNGPTGRGVEIVAYFLKLGALGFGGPVALVGQMKRELVAARPWLTKDEMRQASSAAARGPSGVSTSIAASVTGSLAPRRSSQIVNSAPVATATSSETSEADSRRGETACAEARRAERKDEDEGCDQRGNSKEHVRTSLA